MAIIRVGNEATVPSDRPSLLLDFANSKVLPKNVYFSRSANATYWDGEAQCIGDQNFVRVSEAIGSLSIAALNYNSDVAVAPDGTTTADKMIPTTDNANHYVNGSNDLVTGKTYTVSVYAKAAGYTYIAFQTEMSGVSGYDARTYFDVSNGTIGTVASGATADIIDIGSGWYRCIVTATISSGTTMPVVIGQTTDDFVDFAGNGTDGVYLWGYQIVEGSHPGIYVKTNGVAIQTKQPKQVTASPNQPRFNHDPATGESLGLLIEQSATNLWSESNRSWRSYLKPEVYQGGIAPDGTSTAWIFDQANGGGSGYWYWSGSVTGADVPFSGTPTKHLNMSFFAKIKYVQSNAYIFVGWPNRKVRLRINNGEFELTNQSGTVNHKVEDYGDGWYRVSFTCLEPQAAYEFQVDLSSEVACHFMLWGFQVEDMGTTETGHPVHSYIPTNGAQATVPADLCYSLYTTYDDDNIVYKSLGSSWTIFTEANAKGRMSNSNYRACVFCIEDYERNATWWDFGPNSFGTGNAINTFSYYDGSAQVVSYVGHNGGIASDEFFKGTLSAEQNDMEIRVNNYTPTTDSDNQLGEYNRIYIGCRVGPYQYLCGHIKKLAIFPKKLSSTETAELTEIL